MNSLLSCPEDTLFGVWLALRVGALLFSPIVMTFCLDFPEGETYIYSHTQHHDSEETNA